MVDVPWTVVIEHIQTTTKLRRLQAIMICCPASDPFYEQVVQLSQAYAGLALPPICIMQHSVFNGGALPWKDGAAAEHAALEAYDRMLPRT
jgi:hypothetical protein